MWNLKDRDLNWEVGMRNVEFKGQRTENRGQTTEDRGIRLRILDCRFWIEMVFEKLKCIANG